MFKVVDVPCKTGGDSSIRGALWMAWPKAVTVNGWRSRGGILEMLGISTVDWCLKERRGTEGKLGESRQEQCEELNSEEVGMLFEFCFEARCILSNRWCNLQGRWSRVMMTDLFLLQTSSPFLFLQQKSTGASNAVFNWTWVTVSSVGI